MAQQFQDGQLTAWCELKLLLHGMESAPELQLHLCYCVLHLLPEEDGGRSSVADGLTEITSVRDAPLCGCVCMRWKETEHKSM